MRVQECGRTLINSLFLFLWQCSLPIQLFYLGGAVSPSLSTSKHKPSSFFCHFSQWTQIVYLGQIVSYLRKRKRGCLPTLPSSFPKSSPSFSFSTFFHPRPLHFSFQPFNQSATIRADRVMENNWGGVTGGLTLELWGGGHWREAQGKKPPPQCSVLPGSLFYMFGENMQET